jgi:peroxiredoxin
MKKTLIAVLLLCGIAALVESRAQSQLPVIRPAIMNMEASDFTLPALQGGEYTLSALRGKTVLLVFPRGHVQDTNTWCNICQYQYSELAELDLQKNIRKKNDLEILFILPYDRKTVENWVSTMPEQLREIETWKYPADTVKKTDNVIRWMEISRRLYPKKFDYTDKAPTPLPILYDADRKVTKGMDIFRTEWSGSKVDQNMPTVILIDKKGVVRFKYISQKTYDRPDAEYLLKIVDEIREGL